MAPADIRVILPYGPVASMPNPHNNDEGFSYWLIKYCKKLVCDNDPFVTKLIKDLAYMKGADDGRDARCFYLLDSIQNLDLSSASHMEAMLMSIRGAGNKGEFCSSCVKHGATISHYSKIGWLQRFQVNHKNKLAGGCIQKPSKRHHLLDKVNSLGEKKSEAYLARIVDYLEQAPDVSTDEEN